MWEGHVGVVSAGEPVEEPPGNGWALPGGPPVDPDTRRGRRALDPTPAPGQASPPGPASPPAPAPASPPDQVVATPHRRGGRRRRRITMVWRVAGVTALVALAVTGLANAPVGPLISAALPSGQARGVSTPQPIAKRAPSSGGGSATADEDRDGQVSAALTTMTKALRAHDEKSFLSVAEPTGAALLTRQRSEFRSLSALPLANVEYRWTGRAQSVASPALVRAYGASTVAARVDLRYQLAGWDPQPVDIGLVLTFTVRAGHGVLVSDTDPSVAKPAGRQNPFSEPWVVGATIVVTRPHVLVIGEPKRRADIERTADRMEELVGQVHAIWPEKSWNGKVVAYAMTDKRFVSAWFGKNAATKESSGSQTQASFVALVDVLSTAPPDDDFAPGAPRLVLTPYLLSKSDRYTIDVLRHEMTHVALALVGREVPAWLAEGAAEYTGFRKGGSTVSAVNSFAERGLEVSAARQLQNGTWKARLVSEPDQFYVGSTEKVGGAYTSAWLTCLYIADHYGEKALRKLYDAAAARPRTDTEAEVEAGALAAALHIKRSALIKAVQLFAGHLRRQFQ